MFRLLFVFLLIAFGAFYAAQGPLYALLFYLGNAYFRPEDWVWDHYIISSLSLSLIIGVYLVLRTVMSRPKPQLNFRTGLVLLFLGQAILGTLTSEHIAGSSVFLIEFVKVLLISYLIVVLVDDRKKYRLTLLVIGLSLAFESAKQGWLGLYRNPGGQNNNAIAFLGDNNGVALGMMMLVPILNALASTAGRRWEKVLFRFLAIGVFVRGISTYSRGGFLAAGVLCIFMFVRSERKIRALIGVAALGVLVWNVMPQEFWDRMNTIQAPEEKRDDSAASRIHYWGIAVDMANAKPITGVGLNGFQSSYAAYDPEADKFGGEGRAVHSTWFGVLADLGYPGLILFVANWVMAVWSCWRVHRRVRRDPATRELGIYANALISSLAAYAIAASFLSQQYNEMLWHIIGLSTALYLIAQHERQPVADPIGVRIASAKPLRTLGS